jgi:hypothetical protein
MSSSSSMIIASTGKNQRPNILPVKRRDGKGYRLLK